MSGISLKDALTDINEFLRENPKEILILDIVVDSNSVGTVGNKVPVEQLDKLVKETIEEQFILTRWHAQ